MKKVLIGGLLPVLGLLDIEVGLKDLFLDVFQDLPVEKLFDMLGLGIVQGFTVDVFFERPFLN